jgi:hypothetical protein
MVHREMHLLKHFEELKMVYLAGKADIMCGFLRETFEDNLSQQVKESSLGYLNNQFEFAVQSVVSTVTSDHRKDELKILGLLDPEKISENFFFTERSEATSLQMRTNKYLYFSIDDVSFHLF